MAKRHFVLISLLLVLSGCAAIPIKFPQPGKIKTETKNFKTVLTCDSSLLKIQIGLRPPVVRNPKEEIFYAEEVFILVDIKYNPDFENLPLKFPLRFARTHRIEKGASRTFTEFPSFFVEGLDGTMSIQQLMREYQIFLKEITLGDSESGIPYSMFPDILQAIVVPFRELLDTCIEKMEPSNQSYDLTGRIF